jgi:hypothetical protein
MTTVPQWKIELEKAKLENDTDKLTERVLTAEAAILERVMEICDMPSHAQEIAVLKAASEQLRQIQVKRLGYPDLKPKT